MNTKRWLLASVAVFVVIGVLEFLVHGVLLSGLYKQTASVWRAEAEMRQMMWIFWAGYLVFAPFFTLIYVKGYEKGKPGLGQGFRFGLYVGAMLRSEEHTSELQSRLHLVCRLLLEKKKNTKTPPTSHSLSTTRQAYTPP